MLKAACEKNNIGYERVEPGTLKNAGYEVHAILRDLSDGAAGMYSSTAQVVKDGGAFRLMMDNDTKYSSIAKRCGKNGGTITRDYTLSAVEKGVRRSGGLINMVQEQPDGSIIVKISSVA